MGCRLTPADWHCAICLLPTAYCTSACISAAQGCRAGGRAADGDGGASEHAPTDQLDEAVDGGGDANLGQVWLGPAPTCGLAG